MIDNLFKGQINKFWYYVEELSLVHETNQSVHDITQFKKIRINN